MRWPRALVPLALIAILAACGGGGAAPSEDGGGGGGDATESEPAEASAAPPPDDDGNGDGGGDGGGGGSAELDELLENLTPPNATEVTRQSSDGFLFVIWNSTDSGESLQDFYEGRITDAGFDNVIRTESGGVYSWIFGYDDLPGFGGSVGVGPTTDGADGASVSVQLATGE